MAEENKQPKPRGGFREGAGRKPKDKVSTQRCSICVPRDILEIIDGNYSNRSDFIQKAIKEKLRREMLI